MVGRPCPVISNKASQWQIPLQNRYALLEQDSIPDDFQDQKLENIASNARDQGHIHIQRQGLKNTNNIASKIQQNLNHQSIQQQVQNSTMIVDHGHLGQKGQTRQPIIIPSSDNHINVDSNIEYSQLDRIPDYVLHNKHLCQDYITTVYNRLVLI